MSANNEHEPNRAEDELRAFTSYLQAHPEMKKQLEAELLQGIRSPAVVGDAAFWVERRRKILDKHPELANDP